jgi:hypothetical protein
VATSSALVSRLSRRLKLLSTGNPKTLKGTGKGYAVGILHLAPATFSSYNTCPNHTTECFNNCLFFSGRGAMRKTQDARLRKTHAFFEDRANFLCQLKTDINQLFYNALAENLDTVIRLNGTSDIRWEAYGIPQAMPDIQFYDYTKIFNRKNVPPNYHLTYSFSGTNLKECQAALANGMSVAVPFINPPPMWQGYPVIDGDDDDLRFLTPGPVVFALRPKGTLRKNITSNFLGDTHV